MKSREQLQADRLRRLINAKGKLSPSICKCPCHKPDNKHRKLRRHNYHLYQVEDTLKAYKERLPKKGGRHFKRR